MCGIPGFSRGYQGGTLRVAPPLMQSSCKPGNRDRQKKKKEKGIAFELRFVLVRLRFCQFLMDLWGPGPSKVNKWRGLSRTNQTLMSDLGRLRRRLYGRSFRTDTHSHSQSPTRRIRNLSRWWRVEKGAEGQHKNNKLFCLFGCLRFAFKFCFMDIQCPNMTNIV